MYKAWTSTEQKLCSSLYSAGGLSAAKAEINRSNYSIVERMRMLGIKSPLPSVENLPLGSDRKWYAEEVASMLEMSCAGLKVSLIAEYYNASKRRIEKILYSARKNGFDAYPLRNT